MGKTKNKIPMVVNMVCDGEVQCPLCYASFSMPGGQDYKAGIMDCPWCHKKIEIDPNTADIGNAIINGRAVSNRTLEGVNVIKRVQWHLDVPVCRILAGIKNHIAALGLRERMWLSYHLGCETAEELALIMWGLIRLRAKHKRRLKAV